MTTITSRDAQNKFGQLIDAAQREPVVITRRDRRVPVVVSSERYEELEALEDALWTARGSSAEVRRQPEGLLQGQQYRQDQSAGVPARRDPSAGH